MVSRRCTGARSRPGSGPAASGLAEPGRARTDMKKVLIVDDEQSIVIYLTTVLDDGGYATCSAMDGQEGLGVARREKPDLICLDVMMPSGTEGFQVVWELRNNAEAPLKDVPIVMLTGIHDHTELRFYPESEDGTYKAGEYLPVQGFIDTYLNPASPLYQLAYIGLIIFFCYFYTAIMINPVDVAENIKRSGAYIPGIRPGRQVDHHRRAGGRPSGQPHDAGQRPERQRAGDQDGRS